MEDKIYASFTIKEIERTDDMLVMRFKSPSSLTAYYDIAKEELSFATNNCCVKLPYCDLDEMRKRIIDKFKSFLEQTKYHIKMKDNLHETFFNLYLTQEIKPYFVNAEWENGLLNLYFNSSSIRIVFNPQETDEEKQFMCEIKLGSGLFGDELTKAWERRFVVAPTIAFEKEEWETIKLVIEDYYMDAID
jgi:hypothetical protein